MKPIQGGQVPNAARILSKDDEQSRAAQLAFKALVLYNRRGYYHEAKSLIADVLPYFDRLVESDQSRRSSHVGEINELLVATGDGERALQMVKDLAVPHITKPHLLANMNYILAMHHLRYLKQRAAGTYRRCITQAIDNIEAAKDSNEATELAFLKAFIDNGLAFLRVRQKRHQEALDLCQSAYEFVTAELGEDGICSTDPCCNITWLRSTSYLVD